MTNTIKNIPEDDELLGKLEVIFSNELEGKTDLSSLKDGVNMALSKILAMPEMGIEHLKRKLFLALISKFDLRKGRKVSVNGKKAQILGIKDGNILIGLGEGEKIQIRSIYELISNKFNVIDNLEFLSKIKTYELATYIKKESLIIVDDEDKNILAKIKTNGTGAKIKQVLQTGEMKDIIEIIGETNIEAQKQLNENTLIPKMDKIIKNN